MIACWTTVDDAGFRALHYSRQLLLLALRALRATVAQLTLPALLARGLFTRPMALALCVIFVAAWMSYRELWAAGSKERQSWAPGMLIVFLDGAGAASMADSLGRHARKPAWDTP